MKNLITKGTTPGVALALFDTESQPLYEFTTFLATPKSYDSKHVL